MRIFLCLYVITVNYALSHGMPTSPYTYYYKVYDAETNNYQGHLQRNENGVIKGAYYHLGADGIWYETIYKQDGPIYESNSKIHESPDNLYLNVFGPEEERSDVPEIIIADGNAVIGSTSFQDTVDEPLITTRTRGPTPGGSVTEEDIGSVLNFPGEPSLTSRISPGGNGGSEGGSFLFFPESAVVPSSPSGGGSGSVSISPGISTGGGGISFPTFNNGLDQGNIGPPAIDSSLGGPVPEARPAPETGFTPDSGFVPVEIEVPLTEDGTAGFDILPFDSFGPSIPDTPVINNVIDELPSRSESIQPAETPVEDNVLPAEEEFDAGFDDLFG